MYALFFVVNKYWISMIYALLTRNFVVRIYALFPQIFLDWKAKSADIFTFWMYVSTINTIVLVLIETNGTIYPLIRPLKKLRKLKLLKPLRPMNEYDAIETYETYEKICIKVLIETCFSSYLERILRLRNIRMIRGMRPVHKKYWGNWERLTDIMKYWGMLGYSCIQILLSGYF